LIELLLKKAAEWGNELVLRLPCGHDCVVLPEWIDAAGRFIGRLSCSTCRRIFDAVRLEGWAP